MKRAKPGQGVRRAEGRSGGGRLAVSVRRSRGRQGPDREGGSQSSKTLVLKELNLGQDQGRDSNASENNKVQVPKVGHGIPSAKLRQQHGTVVMSVGP